MKYQQIEAVYQVVACGSFSAAARELHITQSALSHRIRAIEDLIGTAVFVRSSRHVEPTPAGERIAAAGARMLEQMQALHSEFATQGGAMPAGLLRVAATNVGITYLYGDMFERFIEEFPRVELQILGAETPRDALRRVLDRGADAAFAYLPLDEPRVETLALGSAELVLIASPRHKAARGRSIGVDELRQHPFVRHLPGTGARVASDELFLATGDYPQILTESSDVEYIKRVVGLGLGLSIVHLFTVQRELAAGQLKAMRVGRRKLVQDFGLVWRRGFRTSVVDAFSALCGREFAEHPQHYRLAPTPRP